MRRVRGMSNREFMVRFGAPGRVCLVGGTAAIDRAIRLAQRPLCTGGRASAWSHAFIFQGKRVDGKPWLLESDIDLRDGQVRFGVQEHRIDKYGDEKEYPNLAVLNFGLSDAQARRIVASGLDSVARGVRYAAGGALKTYWAILSKRLDRDKKKDTVFCSAFVRALYRAAGIDLAPGIAIRHTTPEHLWRTPVAHRRNRLIRQE
ncbi:MAG: hypothetical protein HYY16_15400 [Planctomycetes bacterium]|nr:hypothetical protein [Planctomycetota bacterium]